MTDTPEQTMARSTSRSQLSGRARLPEIAQHFPNGAYVVFANIYEFTDGTGDRSCPAAASPGSVPGAAQIVPATSRPSSSSRQGSHAIDMCFRPKALRPRLSRDTTQTVMLSRPRNTRSGSIRSTCIHGTRWASDGEPVRTTIVTGGTGLPLHNLDLELPKSLGRKGDGLHLRFRLSCHLNITAIWRVKKTKYFCIPAVATRNDRYDRGGDKTPRMTMPRGSPRGDSKPQSVLRGWVLFGHGMPTSFNGGVDQLRVRTAARLRHQACGSAAVRGTSRNDRDYS